MTEIRSESSIQVVSPEIKADTLAGALKEMRKGVGMTLDEVAEKVPVTKSMLSMIERGVRGLSLETLQALMDTYGFKVMLVRSQESSWEDPVALEEVENG